MNESSAFSISFLKPLGFLMYLVDVYACMRVHITLNVWDPRTELVVWCCANMLLSSEPSCQFSVRY